MRVGHRQALNKERLAKWRAFFIYIEITLLLSHCERGVSGEFEQHAASL